MTIFFSDPPSNLIIDSFRKELTSFKCKSCAYTSINPYPPIINSIENLMSNLAMEDSLDTRMKERLMCGIDKGNIFDNSDLLLGYPLQVDRTKFGKINFKAYIEQIC